jgi:hypothetical protein
MTNLLKPLFVRTARNTILHSLGRTWNAFSPLHTAKRKTRIYISLLKEYRRYANRILIRQSDGNGQIGIPRNRREDNTKVELPKIG